MNFTFIEEEIPYVNFTLRPRFRGLTPPYLVAFKGPVNVTKEGLCDLDDVKGEEPFIRGRMLSFIGEFNCSPEAGVWRQYTFAEIVKNHLWDYTVNFRSLNREGDDVYVVHTSYPTLVELKLSVSIVSPSVSDTVLFHFGINLDKVDNYPSAAYLNDEKSFKKFNLIAFAKDVVNDFEKVLEKVTHATRKVRRVGSDGRFDRTI